MRILFLTTCIALIFSCQSQKATNFIKLTQVHDERSIEFKALSLDTKIEGSILIYELRKNTYYSNDFNWAKIGLIPASTFKIPHSMIALELNIVEDENTMINWNGEKRTFKTWQQDLTLKQAFHYSCVPCYQDIARKIGAKRMNSLVAQFKYGKMDINNNNVDDFWLIGESKISQFEQIDFLKRLYLSQLPISKRTEQIFKQLFIVEQTNNYTLRAKTGLSTQNNNYNGWYVGYLEIKDNVYFFATNINPKENHDKSFNNKRKTFTIKALKQLGIMQ